MNANQIKTKMRVRELGEVYTNKKEVNAMLDLVGDLTYKISARILEPTCGNGNFLDAILERKLIHVEKMYKKHGGIKRVEFNIIKSLTSIYGIDIDSNNVFESRQRLIQRIKNFYSNTLNTNIANNGFYNSIDYILKKNIILGDTLNSQEKIIFSEFKNLTNNYSLIETQYLYSELLKSNKDQKPLKIFNGRNYLDIYLNGDSGE